MAAFMTSVAREEEQTKGSQAWSAAAVTINALWVRKGGKQPGGVGGECELMPDRSKYLNYESLWEHITAAEAEGWHLASQKDHSD